MIAIIGAGGHAKCAYECFKINNLEVKGFFDDNSHKMGQEIINGLAVLGTTDVIASHREIDELFIAIGNNRQRLDKYHWYKEKEYYFPNAVHCRAYLSEFSSYGKGNFFMGASIVNPGSRIGNCCIINTNATVGHDCNMEDGVQIGPGVNIAGGCRLEEGVFIGIGARIAPEVTIGSWSVVGAGSVVLNDLPPHSFSYGIPAKIIRTDCK